MSDNKTDINLNCIVKSNKKDNLESLELIYKDRIGDLLFLIGTILAFISNYQAEKAIIQPEEKPPVKENTTALTISPAELIVLFNLFFLVATIILTYTAYTRLMKDKTDISKNTSPTIVNNLFGNGLATLGSTIRVVGFALGAIGNQIRANNPIS